MWQMVITVFFNSNMKQNFSSHIWNKYSGINPLAMGLDI